MCCVCEAGGERVCKHGMAASILFMTESGACVFARYCIPLFVFSTSAAEPSIHRTPLLVSSRQRADDITRRRQNVLSEQVDLSRTLAAEVAQITSTRRSIFRSVHRCSISDSKLNPSGLGVSFPNETSVDQPGWSEIG